MGSAASLIKVRMGFAYTSNGPWNVAEKKLLFWELRSRPGTFRSLDPKPITSNGHHSTPLAPGNPTFLQREWNAADEARRVGCFRCIGSSWADILRSNSLKLLSCVWEHASTRGKQHPAHISKSNQSSLIAVCSRASWVDAPGALRGSRG